MRERARHDLICWSLVLLMGAAAPASAQQPVSALPAASTSIRVSSVFPAPDARLAVRIATPSGPSAADTTVADSSRRQACHAEMVHNSLWGALAGVAGGILPAFLVEIFGKSKGSGLLVLLGFAAFGATVAGVTTAVSPP